jgi:hypothetical protein
MRILLSLLIGLIFIHLSAQEQLDLQANPIHLWNYPAKVHSVICTMDDPHFVGYHKKGLLQEWVPLYLNEGIEEELKGYLNQGMKTTGEPSDSLVIRVNEFFLTQYSSPIYPKQCSFELNCDVFLKKGADLFWLTGHEGTSSCHETSSNHSLHRALVKQSFEAILAEIDTELLNMDTEVQFTQKKYITPAQVTFKFEDKAIGRSVWGLRHSDSLFVRTEYAFTYVDEETFPSSTDFYVLRPEYGPDLKIVDHSRMAYVSLIELLLHYAINVPYDPERYEIMKLVVDPSSGNLISEDVDKRSYIDAELLIYHSGFSKEEKLTIHYADHEVALLKEEYVRLRISPSMETPRVTIQGADSSEHIQLESLSGTPVRYLIKSKKGKVSAQVLSIADFERYRKREVPVTP